MDPFCSDCWSLSPLLKKLQLEYGDYFTIKYVLCGQLTSLNCKNKPNIIDFLQSKNAQIVKRFRCNSLLLMRMHLPPFSCDQH
ncbi:DsbA family protein [Bacillus sp. N9]